MTDVHQTEVDGIRCFWVETGRPTLAARLIFRHGMVDEPFVESGWQHLFEHLALEGHGGGALQVNGSIGLLETAFDAHGPAETVAAHFGVLTRWLSSPGLDRLAHEAKVLRAEAALRAGNPATDALMWRYGAAGPGLAGWDGPGLGRATPELLAERAGRTLTRDNAVIVLDGPPPAELRLSLPAGERLTVPAARPCVPARPAAYVVPSGVVVSGVVRRSAVMALGHKLLVRALTDELRTGAGAAYAPWATYEVVDADHAVVIGGSDVAGELMSTIANRTLQLVRRLRAVAPEAARLEDARTAHLQAMHDPAARFGLALAMGRDWLFGRELRTLSDLDQEVRGVTGAAVRDGYEELHSTLLLGVPGDATWDSAVPMVKPDSSRVEVHGSRWRSRNWPADRTRLRIDRQGVSLTDGAEDRTVPYDSLAGALVGEDGWRHLVQTDGYSLTIDPREWHRGQKAVARLDQHLPDRLRLPQPPIDRPAPPRAGVVRRWTWPVLRHARRPDLATSICVAIVLFTIALAALMLSTGETDALGPLILLASASLWGVIKVAES